MYIKKSTRVINNLKQGFPTVGTCTVPLGVQVLFPYICLSEVVQLRLAIERKIYLCNIDFQIF